MALVLTSAAFAAGERVPDRHTCSGEDISPPLAWRGAPPGTKSFALIVDDPDAPGGTFFHWALFDLPADTGSVKEGFAARDAIGQSRQARNDFGKRQWGGPCPPPGKPHRYRFRLLALGALPLHAPGDPHCRDVEAAARDSLLEEAILTGTYSRSKR